MSIIFVGVTCVCVASSVSVGKPPGASGRAETPRYRPFVAVADGPAGLLVQVEASQWSQAASRSVAFVVESFPLPDAPPVDLVLRRLTLTSKDTRFVMASDEGDEVPVDVRTDEFVILTGRIVGEPASHVFLFLSDVRSSGWIQPGPGVGGYRVFAGPSAGRSTIVVRPAAGLQAASASVGLCGVEGVQAASSVDAVEAGSVTAGEILWPRTRQVELAVETDYAFFLLHRNPRAAIATVLETYGAVSAIMLRDIDARLVLSFVRIWKKPDPFGPGFVALRYWEQNMGHVHRDLIQFFSGRRDFPNGGVSNTGLCSPSAFSEMGYAMGFNPDPAVTSIDHWNIPVAAHEIGHNLGAFHTNDYGLDNCNRVDSTPQRGTIMSYCSQTVSGGNAVFDLRYHAVPQNRIETKLRGSSCIAVDCNRNDVPDDQDIREGTSPDRNVNGVPDECEDCNGNRVLDDEDIRGGHSRDLNGNGIPDECEPDCNGNDVPDDLDILRGTSLDQYGNNVPDECEADCDRNERSDYTDIQKAMPRDVNRNAALDECEDCDTDDVPDIEELDGGHNIWLGGKDLDGLRELFGYTGVVTNVAQDSDSTVWNDVVISPHRFVLASDQEGDRVVRFELDGSRTGDFVPPGAGGLDGPSGMTYGPDGHLYVAGLQRGHVLKYDGLTGQFLREFVQAGDGGLTRPFGLAFGPADGDLYVTSADNRLLRFDGSTGAYIGDFVTAAFNGNLNEPRGLAFKPDGNLVVASYFGNELLEYDGDTGWFRRKASIGGSGSILRPDGAWGVRIGPDGNVYLVKHLAGNRDGDGEQSHVTTSRIFTYDARTGLYLRSHVVGHDTGIFRPTGFDFAPGWGVDCNYNFLQDDCDIASGRSRDRNHNDVPDECEVDCNGNRVQDRLDIIPYGAEFDCNANLRPDACDIAGGGSSDRNGNGVPDECEVCVADYRLKARCKQIEGHPVITATLKGGEPKAVLTLVLNGRRSLVREVRLNKKGNGKAQWGDIPGTHTVYAVECDLSADTRCRG